MPRYCRDCRWAVAPLNQVAAPPPTAGDWRCRRPVGEVSLVTGERGNANYHCSAERTATVNMACGRDGRFFESRMDVARGLAAPENGQNYTLTFVDGSTRHVTETEVPAGPVRHMMEGSGITPPAVPAPPLQRRRGRTLRQP